MEALSFPNLSEVCVRRIKSEMLLAGHLARVKIRQAHSNCSGYWGLGKLTLKITWLGRNNELT